MDKEFLGRDAGKKKKRPRSEVPMEEEVIARTEAAAAREEEIIRKRPDDPLKDLKAGGSSPREADGEPRAAAANDDAGEGQRGGSTEPPASISPAACPISRRFRYSY